MRSVGDIALDAEVRAIASGAITDGAPVLVNADGTVSKVASTSATKTFGSEVVFENANSNTFKGATYDSNSKRVVIAYKDSANNNYGTAVVGTVSGTSISFGTPVVYASVNNAYIRSTFDSSNNKVVIAYQDDTNEDGKAIVGTVDSSDNSISFGSAAQFNAAKVGDIGACFDSSNNKVVIAYRDYGNSQYGTAIVGTVSSTSISFGSEAVFESATTDYSNAVFDSNSNKVVIFYKDGGNSSYGTSVVATVSGTSISFGTPVVFESAASTGDQYGATFDTTANKTVVVYKDTGDSNKLKGIVGTVSGTSISYGSAADITTNNSSYPSAVYMPDANKTLVAYTDEGASLIGVLSFGTISGTDISFSTPETFRGASDYTTRATTTYDIENKVAVIAYVHGSGSSFLGKAKVIQGAYTDENITSENFIGFAHAAYADGQKATVKTTGSIARNIPQQAQAAAYGSVVQFDAGNLSTGDSNALAFDSSNNKVVLIYRDNGNSNYGTALVGTIDTSDNSISWGSATVFESAAIGGTSLTFDSSNNKVVGFFKDIGDSNVMKSIVGTVSGTSISFGSVANVSTAGADNAAATFDTNSNKVVVAFTDSNNSGYGTARVGTVSGTSISFGTAVVYTSAEANHEADSITFDSSNNRVVIAYTLSSGTNRGNAIVGTVSGTDISFGTQVAFNANFSSAQTATFDTSNNKVVIAFQDSSNSDQGTAVVGTVDSSDNSISFGSEAIFNAAGTDNISSTFDNTNNTVLVSYRDAGDNNNGTIVVGTVSGTSISFGSENKYTTGDAVNTYNSRIIYDSNAKRAVVIYTEGGASGRGDSRVFSPATNLDLTIGQQYFVQTDGSLDTSADDPSVIAGTAIGTSELIVKG